MVPMHETKPELLQAQQQAAQSAFDVEAALLSQIAAEVQQLG
jgi:hypothetical protein